MTQGTATRQVQGVDLPAAGTWELDPAHSSVSFVARHLMVAKVRGGFTKFEGVLRVAENPVESSAEVTIDAASISTAEEGRDQHLRSADFLNVEAFPTLRFRTTSLEPTGDNTFDLHGELTIRDTTKPVTLHATYEGAQTDPWGNAKIAFSATTEIDREEFGITWNQALETGGVLVGKKVRIELDVSAKKIEKL